MKIRGWGRDYNVVPVASRYAVGETLAVQLKCWNDEYGMWEPYGSLTVKLNDEFEGEETAYVDVNNIPEAEKFIQENGLGVPTGGFKMSGYCVYPLYKFDLTKIGG